MYRSKWCGTDDLSKTTILRNRKLHWVVILYRESSLNSDFSRLHQCSVLLGLVRCTPGVWFVVLAPLGLVNHDITSMDYQGLHYNDNVYYRCEIMNSGSGRI